jgi:hypothetical protein
MRYALIVVALLASACGGGDKNPVQPAPVIPACQANNTAQASFGNRSTSNTTYDIVWDGVRVGTLAAGQTSPANTVAASVAHTLRFQITNTTLLACSQSTPTLAQCGNQTFTCTF